MKNEIAQALLAEPDLRVAAARFSAHFDTFGAVLKTDDFHRFMQKPWDAYHNLMSLTWNLVVRTPVTRQADVTTGSLRQTLYKLAAEVWNTSHAVGHAIGLGQEAFNRDPALVAQFGEEHRDKILQMFQSVPIVVLFLKAQVSRVAELRRQRYDAAMLERYNTTAFKLGNELKRVPTPAELFQAAYELGIADAEKKGKK